MAYDLKKALAQKTDEQLIDIVTVNSEGYRPVAIEAAEEELQKRGADPSKAAAVKEQLIRDDEERASRNARMMHYMVDYLTIFLLLSVILITAIYLSENTVYKLQPWHMLVLGILTVLLYYILTESVFGKTAGKFLSQTRVVTSGGQKPAFKTIVLRTFCRLIPFSAAFSLLSKHTLHDLLSGTKVIND